MRSEVSEERGLSKPWKNFTLRKNVEVVQNCGEEGGHGDASMCGVSGKTNQRRLRKCGHRDIETGIPVQEMSHQEEAGGCFMGSC